MADYQLSVKIIGAKELRAAIDNVGFVAQGALKDAMNKTAIELEALARSKAPHKKGGLWGSIHAEPAQVTQTNVIAKVGTKLKYARAQEYGTQGMTIHGRSKLGTRFDYIGNIPPKYYMRDAREEVRPSMTAHLTAALKKIVDSIATRGTE